MNLKYTALLLGFGVMGLLILTAWTEAIQRWLFSIFHLNDKAASSWFILAIVFTAGFLLTLQLFGVELHDLIGISETVDVELTKEKEAFRKGRLVHISVAK